MPKPSPHQPTFAEAEEIARNPHLQWLLRTYPNQQHRVLAAWRRRQRPFAKPCLCLNCNATPPAPPRHRPKTPSTRGQYRQQLHK